MVRTSPRGRPVAELTAGAAGMAAAYSQTGAAWQAGPGRVYDRLAEVLVAASPLPLTGRLVLDVGSGTGAASRAIEQAGGRPVACDLAAGMLATLAGAGWPGLVADARALPLRDASVDAVVAAFSFNHVPDPDAALAEAARAVTPGGAVLASAYAEDDDHPVKRAVDAAALEAGWQPDPWITEVRADAAPRLATVERARAAAEAAGLAGAVVSHVEVPFPDLDADDLVAWRLGMAQVAPWLATVPERERAAIARRARELLGHAPPLVRRMIVIAATT